MSDFYEALAARIEARFGERVTRVPSRCGELTYEIGDKADLVEVCTALRDEPEFAFEQLIDLCGVDYLTYGLDEWTTESATESGFSRGVVREAVILDEADTFDPKRFAVVYHLLSLKHNARLRLRVYTGLENPPVVDSVFPVWNSADWFEREAFDLFGILFAGHPDLRRILTDYGFIGHPFRKDFPLIGTAEVRYDTEKGRVIYQPVSIEPRTLVPKVIRDDNRYRPELKERPVGG
jgi:NADH-quinone oxidoreductase subunit C